jgi:hypothetical protein
MDATTGLIRGTGKVAVMHLARRQSHKPLYASHPGGDQQVQEQNVGIRVGLSRRMQIMFQVSLGAVASQIPANAL